MLRPLESPSGNPVFTSTPSNRSIEGRRRSVSTTSTRRMVEARAPARLRVTEVRPSPCLAEPMSKRFNGLFVSRAISVAASLKYWRAAKGSELRKVTRWGSTPPGSTMRAGTSSASRCWPGAVTASGLRRSSSEVPSSVRSKCFIAAASTHKKGYNLLQQIKMLQSQDGGGHC